MSQEKSIKRLRIEELIKRNTWDIDKEPHIIILDDKKLPIKALTKLCPMRCYVVEENRVVFHYEECVECGLCRILSDSTVLKWEYPRGGKGIIFRRM
ncbi:MAG: ferredoxin family protein [Sulfolobales archaeon]|jgi:ferredoxin like protein